MAGGAALYLALVVATQTAPAPPPTTPRSPVLPDSGPAKDAAADESCTACSLKRDLAFDNRSSSEVRAIRLSKSNAMNGVISNLFRGRSDRSKGEPQELLGGKPVPRGTRRTVAVNIGLCTASGPGSTRCTSCAAGLVITADDVVRAKPPAPPAPVPPRP
ncbi:MAG: hypothetical protein EOP59_08930 [Sphingomonadales bacterium]|nr:MAG: hypothetical protein EOP59_08930 [Sphingomonadales bacterium]